MGPWQGILAMGAGLGFEGARIHRDVGFTASRV